MRVIFALLLVASASQALAAAKPGRTVAEEGFKAAECTADFAQAYEEADSYDLGGGQTLYVMLCWRAAYQSGSIVFAGTEDKARLLSFQDWDGKKFTTARALSEADYDPEKKTMASYYKGRGVGDCGTMGEWTWTGSEFKLAKYFFKKDCDGKAFNGERRWQIFPRR